MNSLTDPASIRHRRELWKQHCQERLEPFLAAVRAHPLDARAHYGVGLLYLLGSEGAKASLQAALRSANRSAALRADSAEVHALLATIHDQLGDPKRALASAREAARLAPRDRDYTNFLLAMLASAARTRHFRSVRRATGVARGAA